MQQKYKGKPTPKLAFRREEIDNLVDSSIVLLTLRVTGRTKLQSEAAQLCAIRVYALVSHLIPHKQKLETLFSRYIACTRNHRYLSRAEQYCFVWSVWPNSHIWDRLR